jgi:hypothetical protein
MSKQKYQVIKATKRPFNTIKVDDHEMSVPKKFGAFTVVDEGMAHEIDARYGVKGQEMAGQVVVCPVNTNPDPIHPRTFTVPELPWKRGKDND